MSVVVEAIGSAVSFVADTVGDVVETALNDPIGTIAKVAAVATGQFELLPVISAADTVAHGGDLGDALKSAAISYAAQGAGSYVGGELDTALNYGTDLGSAQTAMLAAQDAGLGMGTAIGGAGAAATGAATGALLSGGDVGQAVLGGLAGYGARLGMDLSLDAAGRVVDEFGDVVANSYDELTATMGDQYGDQVGDYPTTPEDLAAADAELASIETPDTLANQLNSYDANAQDIAEAELQMGVDSQTADQPGDYPTTPEELAAADAELATMPAFEQYADQPGDYPTTPEELAAADAELATMPGAESTDFTVDSSAAQKYALDQIKRQLLKNLFGSEGTNYTKRGVAGSLFSGLGSVTGEDGFSPADTSVAGETPTQNADFSLFNPLTNASWAPQTKIGGLGAAGKYINQENDTYYVNPEQAKRERALQDNNQEIGWTPIGEEAQPQEDTNSPYFGYGDVQYAAEGGSIGHVPQFYSEGGALANRYVKGDGDGTSDSVPAMLASGEFVIPADIVSGLGNGDNDAGALVLDEFMKSIRQHKRAADPSELPPDSKGPLSYLEEAFKKVKK